VSPHRPRCARGLLWFRFLTSGSEGVIRHFGREHGVERSKLSLRRFSHACRYCVSNPHGSPCSWASTGDRRWRKPPTWTVNPISGERLRSCHGLPDRLRPCPGRRSPRIARPGRLPPASRRSTFSSPPCPCTGLSAMHEHDRPGGYGGRRRHCSQPPGLIPCTRDQTVQGSTDPLYKGPDRTRAMGGLRTPLLLTTVSLRRPQRDARAR